MGMEYQNSRDKVVDMRKIIVFEKLLMSLILLLAFAGTLVYAATPAKTDSSPATVIDKNLKANIRKSIDRGLTWLQAQQEKNGSYANHVGITGLVATAYMRSPRHYGEKDSKFIESAIKYILSMVKPDGGIYDKDMPNYNTSISIMALVETKNPAYNNIIKNAQKYIMGLQFDESDGYTTDDKMYGGIGYGNPLGSGSDLRPDLSNLKYSLEALKASGVPKDSEVWKKAIKFIERCQNRSESNDQSWSGNDGGFIYSPSESKAGKTKSYGSMTYAGILSFIYANVDKKDQRVQDAVKWINANYTLDENPGMDQEGLYYYYHTMAKALDAYGDPVITDSKGVQHNWYADLANKLMKLQKPDGSWANEADRWMEAMPILTTSYAVLALSASYPD